MSGKNTSISLGEHFLSFVETKVSEGRYHTASEVVRAGLRLLEEQEAKLSALRSALIEGEESGASAPFEFDEFITRNGGNGPLSDGSLPPLTACEKGPV